MRPTEVVRGCGVGVACGVSGTTDCDDDSHRFVGAARCDRVDVVGVGSCTSGGYRTTSNGECWHRAQGLGWCDGDHVGRSDSVPVFGRSCDCYGGDGRCGSVMREGELGGCCRVVVASCVGYSAGCDVDGHCLVVVGRGECVCPDRVRAGAGTGGGYRSS